MPNHIPDKMCYRWQPVFLVLRLEHKKAIADHLKS